MRQLLFYLLSRPCRAENSAGGPVCSLSYFPTVITSAVSTAVFTMDEGSGRALLARYGADAYWLCPDGFAAWTEGLTAYFHP